MVRELPGVRGILLLYPLPLVVFGLVAYCGIWSIAVGGVRFGLPWAVAGLAGAVGAVTMLAVAVDVRRAGVMERSALTRATMVVRTSRWLMVAVAVGVAVLGVAIAPSGTDRGFVIGVNVGLGVALALFALFASDVDRLICTAG